MKNLVLYRVSGVGVCLINGYEFVYNNFWDVVFFVIFVFKGVMGEFVLYGYLFVFFEEYLYDFSNVVLVN